MADLRTTGIGMLILLSLLMSAINTVLCNLEWAFLYFFVGLGFFYTLTRTWNSTKEV